MSKTDNTPIHVQHLFRPLDKKLIVLLESLAVEELNRQTVASKWKVKDVISHLLDGNIKTLSIQRDNYFGVSPPLTDSYGDLVNWLNQLNDDWIKATRRISLDVLILLHKATGQLVSDYYESLDLMEKAIFPVDWAGESASYNWMHIAREYTEKWHHQQQIREATNRRGIMTRELYYPVIDTFFRSLPYTFKNTNAKQGTTIQVTITSEIGGDWFLSKESVNWVLTTERGEETDARVEISPKLSWKLFTKSLRPHEISHQVKITGNEDLGRKVLEMVSVMA